jgi:murein DD-endopeptidase MepM/ murein hydrolase activator NlpD
MQDTTYVSPYRSREGKMEKELVMPKFIKKLIKKTICAGVVLGGIACMCNVEWITSSNIWQKAIDVFGYDIDYEEAKTTLSEAVVFIKEKFPEYFDSEVVSTQIDFNEQMQMDVRKILDKTTVLRPVSGGATQRFERKDNTIIHSGVDLAADIGTPVKAAIGGKVIKVESLEDSFGTYVKVQNENIVTTYAHCSTIEVKEGDLVEQGSIIAYTGNTGKSTGPHLHFEISIDDRFVDPGFLLTYSN